MVPEAAGENAIIQGLHTGSNDVDYWTRCFGAVGVGGLLHVTSDQKSTDNFQVQ